MMEQPVEERRGHDRVAEDFNSSSEFARGKGWKSRCRISSTFFSTIPFSQPAAGLQNSGSNRKWLAMAENRALT